MEEMRQMIKKYRTEHGVTQTFLAKKTGIPVKRINAYETGRYRMSADVFLKVVVEGFQTTPQKFFDFVLSENMREGKNCE